jgi:hypothetical protein
MMAFGVVISSAFTVAASVPYMVAILRRTAKPRISSWSIWTAAQVIGACSAYHQIPAALYVGFCAVECAAIAVLGFRYGDRSFDRLDVICALTASSGLVLLVIVRAPASAVLVSVLTDFLAYVPTVKHAWYKPFEETWITYFLFGIGSGVVLLISNLHVLTAIAYPVYLLLCDTAVSGIILTSPHRQAIPAGLEESRRPALPRRRPPGRIPRRRRPLRGRGCR